MIEGARGQRRNVLPLALAAVVVVLTVLVLKLEGRVWYCACGSWAPWKSDVWSSHCSQHIADPYSVSHASHGLLFWCLFSSLGDRVLPGWNPAAARKFTFWWRFLLAIFAASAWEIAENSTYIIERYRTVTMSLDYMGDSVVNATCDVLFCGLGFFIAHKLRMVRTLVLFALFEVVLLLTIKDNLTLNVIMLVWPIQAIKNWQAGGHLPPPA